MNTKIILNLEDNNASVNYEPALESDSFVAYMNNALNTMPNALLNMLTLIPLLRPASKRESEINAYVVNEGERGEVENNLYKYRKNLYDNIAAVFSQVLATAFPDIEYLEACKHYQQELCVTSTKEEVEEYTNKLNEVTAYVRENFEEVLKEVLEHEEEESVSE